jgi:hypothetical protein
VHLYLSALSEIILFWARPQVQAAPIRAKCADPKGEGDERAKGQLAECDPDCTITMDLLSNLQQRLNPKF